jgi:hypothetical protein
MFVTEILQNMAAVQQSKAIMDNFNVECAGLLTTKYVLHKNKMK